MHQKEMHEGKIHRHLLCNATTAASGFFIGSVGDYTRLRESNSIFHFYCYYLLCIIDQSGIHLSESNICLLPSATTNRQAALLSWEMSELRLYSHPSLQKKRVIEKIICNNKIFFSILPLTLGGEPMKNHPAFLQNRCWRGISCLSYKTCQSDFFDSKDKVLMKSCTAQAAKN